MQPGQIVKFAEPVSAGEAASRFRIIELRGDRALVEDATREWAIVPRFVYLLADLKPADPVQ